MELVYYSGLITLTLLPIQSILLWFFEKSRDIQHKLDIDPTLIRVSSVPALHGIIILFQFLKGFYIPYATDHLLFYNDTFLLISIIATLAFHFFSPLNSFKPQPYWFIVLAGISTFIDIKIGIFVVLFTLCLTLILNSFVIGLLISLFLSLFLVLTFGLAPIYLLAMLSCFCIVFLALNDEAIDYFSTNPLTLYQHFKNR
jgi:hypothetical protein